MPRYRQVVKPDGSFEFVEIASTASTNRSAAVHGDIDAFRSPVDGSIISDRKALREHNQRNNVVNTADLGSDGYNRERQKERERFFKGEISQEERLTRRQQMWEIAQHLERQNER